MDTKKQTSTVTLEMNDLMSGDIVAPMAKETAEASSSNEKLLPDGRINHALITQEDRERYSRINKSLVHTDMNSISNYGSELQNTLSSYSDEFLSAVRMSQGDEMTQLIGDLISELDGVNVDELNTQGGFKNFLRKIPIFKHLVKSLDGIIRKYDTVKNSVDSIALKIDGTRLVALRDNTALQTMFNNNTSYIKQLEELIIAAKLKFEELQIKSKEIIANTSQDSQEVNDLQQYMHNLEKKIGDMVTMRYVMKQSLIQIRTVQYNNLALANKAQTIIQTTIPIWRNQLSISLALRNQKNGAKAQRLVTDTTNELLERNANMLHQTSVDIARESERSVVSIETLRKTTQHLIDTAREVRDIHEEGRRKRQEAEREMIRLEAEFQANVRQALSKTSSSVGFPR